MRLLVVSDWFPYPPIAGAKIRAYGLIRQLARLADLDLVAQVNTLSDEQVSKGETQLRRLCQTVASVPAIPYRYSTLNALRLLVDPVPAVVRHKRNRRLESLLAARLAKPYDAAIVTISGAPSATLDSLVRLGARPLIADSLELGVFRPRSTTPVLQRLRNHFTWWHTRRFARQILEHVDVMTVASEKERRLFAGLVSAPDQCVVVPNVLDLCDYEGDYGPRQSGSLLFPGSLGYTANYEAVQWFTEEVWPCLQTDDHLTVRVTGSTAGRDLSTFQDACPQIEFTGFVADIKPYFAKSDICIVPIRSGGSTRLKILEAMAWGTPVVSTRIGAEGIAVTHEEDILLADTPEEFAAGIRRLISDPGLWQRVSLAGRALVAQRYSADKMYRKYCGIVSHLTGAIATPAEEE